MNWLKCRRLASHSWLAKIENFRSRAISASKYAILIQGETSTGKTSLISYLAKKSGNKLIRINNHEHTDLQEYVGSYVPSEDGSLGGSSIRFSDWLHSKMTDFSVPFIHKCPKIGHVKKNIRKIFGQFCTWAKPFSDIFVLCLHRNFPTFWMWFSDWFEMLFNQNCRPLLSFFVWFTCSSYAKWLVAFTWRIEFGATRCPRSAKSCPGW